mmetsp:Transcript_75474/g.214650  ORF Transcript_75474/g.214650 Transcript_75474/m.214650 type:complete len:151 (+) Transcript_75474:130-582(+)
MHCAAGGGGCAVNKTVSAEEQGGAAEVVPPLPPHWTQHRDETSGYDYFYNDVTGTTQWERPVADAPAPAPAPPPPPTTTPAPAPTAEPTAEPTADDRELMEWARQNPDATEVRREGKQIAAACPNLTEIGLRDTQGDCLVFGERRGARGW